MNRAERLTHEAARSTPPWGSPVPDTLEKSLQDEESQIKLRAPLPAEAYYREDPFPLVRERLNEIEELPIDITFDHVFDERDTPVIARRENVATAREGVDVEAPTVLAYGPTNAPYPPSFYPSYFESPPSARDVSPYPVPKRWTARAILARVAFGVIFLAVAALLAYEIRILLQSGSWPLP